MSNWKIKCLKTPSIISPTKSSLWIPPVNEENEDDDFFEQREPKRYSFKNHILQRKLINSSTEEINHSKYKTLIKIYNTLNFFTSNIILCSCQYYGITYK